MKYGDIMYSENEYYAISWQLGFMSCDGALWVIKELAFSFLKWLHNWKGIHFLNILINLCSSCRKKNTFARMLWYWGAWMFGIVSYTTNTPGCCFLLKPLRMIKILLINSWLIRNKKPLHYLSWETHRGLWGSTHTWGGNLLACTPVL